MAAAHTCTCVTKWPSQNASRLVRNAAVPRSITTSLSTTYSFEHAWVDHLDGGAPASAPALQRARMMDHREAAGERRGQLFGQLVGMEWRQEAERAEVERQQRRHRAVAKHVASPQQSAVAAEHEAEVERARDAVWDCVIAVAADADAAGAGLAAVVAGTSATAPRVHAVDLHQRRPVHDDLGFEAEGQRLAIRIGRRKRRQLRPRRWAWGWRRAGDARWGRWAMRAAVDVGGRARRRRAGRRGVPRPHRFARQSAPHAVAATAACTAGIGAAAKRPLLAAAAAAVDASALMGQIFAGASTLAGHALASATALIATALMGRPHAGTAYAANASPACTGRAPHVHPHDRLDVHKEAVCAEPPQRGLKVRQHARRQLCHEQHGARLAEPVERQRCRTDWRLGVPVAARLSGGRASRGIGQ
eukprot:355743-Chlamydomonas_euryale.AAC.1